MTITAFAQGTLNTATVGSEDWLASPNVVGEFRLLLDNTNLAAGDRLEVYEHKIPLTSGAVIKRLIAVFEGAQSANDAFFTSDWLPNELTDTNAVRYSVKQTFGTGRAFGWVVFRRTDQADVTRWNGGAVPAPNQTGVPIADVGYWKGTAAAAVDTNGYPKVTIKNGTGAGELDFTSGVVKANLAQILGTALTETAGQIAAAFRQFFNIASPTSTMNTITTVTTAVNLTTNNDKTGYGLADGAITPAKIADGALTAAKFASGAFDAVWSVTTRTLTGFGTLVADIWAGVTQAFFAKFFTQNSGTTFTSAVAGSVVKELADNVSGGGGDVNVIQIGGEDVVLDADGFLQVALRDDAIDVNKIQDTGPDALVFVTPQENAAAFLNEPLAGYTDPGTLGQVVQENATLLGDLNDLSAADVNAQMLDVLTVDTFPEPTGVPAATSSIKDKIGYVTRETRNKRTQTATQTRTYADDGTTVVGTRAISDDGTTTTVGKDT